MNEQDKVLRFMLPDLLGKPVGFTDKEGNMIFGVEIPPDSYIFFIPIEEWKGFKEVKKDGT